MIKRTPRGGLIANWLLPKLAKRENQSKVGPQQPDGAATASSNELSGRRATGLWSQVNASVDIVDRAAAEPREIKKDAEEHSASCLVSVPTGDVFAIKDERDYQAVKARIRRRHKRVREISIHDPELALVEARRAAEAACKLLLLHRGRALVKGEALEQLRGQLQNDAIPPTVRAALDTVQRLGNFAAHDRSTAEYGEVGTDGRRVSQATLNHCLAALDAVNDWIFGALLQEAPPQPCVEPSGMWKLPLRDHEA